MYGGIAILFFYLTIYLQEVAGYSALESWPRDGSGDDRDVHVVAASARSPTATGRASSWEPAR
jgi:hypothetical protein